MTEDMEKVVFKKGIMRQADLLRWVGHKVRKVIHSREKIEELENKYRDIEFDLYMYEDPDGWIRLNTEDVYLYVKFCGEDLYDLDPYCHDFVVSLSYDEFIKDVVAYEFYDEEWKELRDFLYEWHYFDKAEGDANDDD